MFKAAATKVDITPPVGVDLQGYANRHKGSEDIQDHLYARCVVIESDKDTRWALITADLISFEHEDAQCIHEIAKEILNVPNAFVSVAATHNHSGPAMLNMRNFGERHDAYIEHLVEVIGRSLTETVDQLQPAVPISRSGFASFAVNRRKPTPDGSIVLAPYPAGPVDHGVTMTAIFPVDEVQSTGLESISPIAVLTNYACHPVTLGANYRISADFPGVFARAVESIFSNCVAVYLNGAAGDINPPAMDGSITTELCGVELSAVAVKSIIQAHRLKEEASHQDFHFAFREKTIELPLGPLPSRDELLRWIDEYEQKVEELKEREDGSANSWQALASWAKSCFDELGGKESEFTDRNKALLQSVSFGDTGMIFVPGELFCELGLAIKAESSFPYTHVVGYSNGWIGYVPTKEAIELGGYETTAYRYWQSRPFAPETGDLIVREAVELLRQVGSD